MTHYPDCRNPVLPPQLAIPDPEARVMPDGRVYVYGSWDQTTDHFCSAQYRVFSSADLVDWVDHGESFSSAQVPWVHDEAAAQRYPGVKWFSREHATPFVKGLMDKARSDPDFRIPQFPKGLLFAPDAIHRKGRYYLYFCMPDQTEGVAVADHPVGPFSGARQLACSGIECVNGRWHVFYHRASRRSQGWRRLCTEPIAFGADGGIREVAMSSIGAGWPFALDEPIEAWRACELQGQAWIGPLDDGSEALHLAGPGESACFRWVDWSAAATGWSLQARGSGQLALEVGGRPAGQATVVEGRVAHASLQAPAGRHPLRLQLLAGSGLQVLGFTATGQQT